MSTFLFSPVVLGLAATLVVLFLMTRGRKVMMRICLAVAVLAFFGGLVLYTVGYMPEAGTAGDVAIAMLRGLFSTGGMLLINNDYGFLIDDPSKAWLTDNMAFQVVFWLCHVLALIVTVSTVMGLFGYKLINTMRLRLRLYHTCTIICGTGGNALALGENIATHDGTREKPDPKRLVVYLVPAASDELYETLAAFNAIPMEYDNVRFAARLRSAGLAAKPWRIHSFRVVLMPDSEAQGMTLLHEILQTASELAMPPERLSIHLLSENAWVQQYIQDTPSLANARWSIHTAGEAELAARRMIIAQPPCLALPFENAVAGRDLVVLVLGFGKTGVQALRRLIMNGQYVGSNMRAIVVDREIESRRGAFEQAYPAFRQRDSAAGQTGAAQEDITPRCCTFEYHAMDIRSREFFAELDRCGGSINYVVIALNDDCQNLEAGQLVLSHFRRRGWSQPRMALAISAGEGAGSGMHDAVFFSRQSDIYSEATVIRENTDAMAMAVNYAYEESCNGPQTKSPRQLWYGLDHFSHESSRASADYIPSMLHLAGLTPQQAAARDTLSGDAQLQETLAHTEHLRWNAFHCAMGYTTMPVETMGERFRQMKETGGDLTGCRKDKILQQHACIVPWDKLSEVSDALNKLLKAEEMDGGRDFQQEDRAIIRSIPFSIKVANEYFERGRAYDD